MSDSIFDAIAKTLGLLWLLGCMVTWIMAEGHMVTPPNPPTGRIKRTWFIARFDKWIGLYEVDGTRRAGYWDKKAYWLPLPCIGVKLEREAPAPADQPTKENK